MAQAAQKRSVAQEAWEETATAHTNAEELEHIGAALKEKILCAYEELVYCINTADKDMLRGLHLRAKLAAPGVNVPELLRRFDRFHYFFKQGHEIDPGKIRPRLISADTGIWAQIFPLVRSLWSMPYNKGYGRRIRYVVFDDYHQGVMGIIGLQSPPADLECRDILFNCPKGEKLSLVNRTLDAYTVGAIPPYSFLLGGKLCAGLIATDTVRRTYWKKYAGKKTEMDEVRIQQPLVAVTTTSVFGRSSIYNRLKFGSRLLARPIGYTQGFGTIHLEHLYSEIAEYLKLRNEFKHGGYGNGPKVRWQNITNAATALKVQRGALKHGIAREVFLFPLVENLEQGMSGGQFGQPLQLEEEDFSSYWKERWAVPRAERFPEWREQDSRILVKQKLEELRSQAAT